MPLSSTNALPFAVSAVQSACADADDEARTKVRAAIAEHILDIAAALLMVIFGTRAGRQRPCLHATTITTSTFVTCEARSLGRGSNVGRSKPLPPADLVGRMI